MITCDRQQPAHYLSTDTGKRYPSVSQVLDVLYGDRFAYVKPDVLAEAQARGIRRHLLFGVLVLWRAGLCDKPQIDPRDTAVADGLTRWIIEHAVHPLQVEEPSVNEKDGYAGTPDLLCLYGPSRTILLPDLKTGVHAEAHAVQVQAYVRLKGYTSAQALMDLYVDENGRVREQLVTLNPHDWAFFLNGLGVLKGRLARNI